MCVWAVEIRSVSGVVTGFIPVSPHLMPLEATQYIAARDRKIAMDVFENFALGRVIPLPTMAAVPEWIDTGLRIPTRTRGPLHLFRRNPDWTGEKGWQKVGPSVSEQLFR